MKLITTDELVADILANLGAEKEDTGKLFLFMASDPEGNSYHAVDETGWGLFDTENKCLVDREELGLEEDDPLPEGIVKCFIIWPGEQTQGKGTRGKKMKKNI